jgi:type IV pilus assembly protein PilA
MKETKGFTLVELMIVVAIIGILAAVAVPYYQKYIQKSRLTSMVWPGIHAIETNIASYYSANGALPTSSTTLNAMYTDANTAYFNPSNSNTTYVFAIAGTSGSGNPLLSLKGQSIMATPILSNGKIAYWSYSGSIATSLGLVGPQ